MKKKSLGIVLTLIIIATLTAMPVFAAPAGTWVTDFTLYNLSGSQAAIQIMRYGMFAGGTPDAGSLVKETLIDPNGSFYYNPAGDGAFPSNFSGSIVVSSSQQLAGTVTIANNLSGTGFASDAYSAVGAPNSTQYLPIVMGHLGVWNTRISIQNAGSVNAKVTVKYVGAGAPASEIVNGLPPNQTAQLDNFSTAGMTGFNGSAVVTAVDAANPGNPVNIAVVVEEYRTSGGMLVVYNGTPDADTTVYMPGYLDQNSWGTDFTIVNTENAATTATVKFAGSTTVSGPIPANGAVYLNRSLPTGWTGTFPNNYYGAATITSTTKVVVAYNIANTARGGASNLGIGYLGFPQSGASGTVIVPLIENKYSSGWSTTYSVQSVDGTPANLSLSYSGNKAPLCNPCTVNMTTASQTFNQLYDGHIPTGFIGGVTITANKNIVVIADQNVDMATPYAAGDAAAGFAGFKK